MTVSEFYRNRNLIESFGRSKIFEVCRKMRDVWPGFPQYQDTASEFICAWLILIAAKTGNTTTRQAVESAINSGKKLKCGDELFVVWLGTILTNPRDINNIFSIWIFQDADFIEVRTKSGIKIFQGPEKVKQVSRAVHLSQQFIYDFSKDLIADLKDESLENEKVF